MRDRLRGYEKAIAAATLRPHVLELPLAGTSVEREVLIKGFLENDPSLDAIFFATNYLAQWGLLVIKENFPQKIHSWGILTFDDNEFFKIQSPTITGIAQPMEKIGKALMKVMLDLL